jgi:hypothetical protein
MAIFKALLIVLALSVLINYVPIWVTGAILGYYAMAYHTKG